MKDSSRGNILFLEKAWKKWHESKGANLLTEFLNKKTGAQDVVNITFSIFVAGYTSAVEGNDYGNFDELSTLRTPNRNGRSE